MEGFAPLGPPAGHCPCTPLGPRRPLDPSLVSVGFFSKAIPMPVYTKLKIGKTGRCKAVLCSFCVLFLLKSFSFSLRGLRTLTPTFQLTFPFLIPMPEFTNHVGTWLYFAKMEGSRGTTYEYRTVVDCCVVTGLATVALGCDFHSFIEFQFCFFCSEEKSSENQNNNRFVWHAWHMLYLENTVLLNYSMVSYSVFVIIK